MAAQMAAGIAMEQADGAAEKSISDRLTIAEADV
jgi:hypothetical protein